MKKAIILFVIILIALVAFAGIFLYNQKSKDISKISDKEIILLLKNNIDAKEYLQSHPDYKIQDKIILTKDSIIAGQKGQNFKEVYQGLDLENNRYVKVNLMNLAGDRGLVAVIDFKTKQVPKAYGIMLFKAGMNQNGQTPSTTTNK